ncbi:MAG: hypothetical protein HOM86_21650 [Gemmatimonadetes bacterium]|jgi:hypothetical protein|nr:hypothetical protein [Gemmatimonadota bacterium]
MKVSHSTTNRVFRAVYTACICAVFLSGCTNMILKAAGVDPKTVKITPLPRTELSQYDYILNSISPLAGQIRGHAIYVAPTEIEAEKWVNKNPSLRAAFQVYSDQIEDALGYKRSDEELNSIFYPPVSYNVWLWWDYYVYEAIKKRNIFGNIEFTSSDKPIEASVGVIVIRPDLSDPSSARLIVSNGAASVALNATDIWNAEKNEKKSIMELLNWLENVSLKI